MPYPSVPCSFVGEGVCLSKEPRRLVGSFRRRFIELANRTCIEDFASVCLFDNHHCDPPALGEITSSESFPISIHISSNTLLRVYSEHQLTKKVTFFPYTYRGNHSASTPIYGEITLTRTNSSPNSSIRLLCICSKSRCLTWSCPRRVRHWRRPL